MKKFLALITAAVMIFTLTSCGKDIKPISLSVYLGPEPENIDPALNSSVDGATILAHLFSGIAKWSQDENGDMIIVPDAAEELTDGITNDDGTVTYTYKLRNGLVWSDGKSVTADDFVYSWNRAASHALSSDCNYMFDVIVGYRDMWEGIYTDEVDDNRKNISGYINPDAKLAVKALDERTLEVTLTNRITYWNELLAFPAFYPVREDVVSNDDWATGADNYISNGAYSITGWEHNSVITLTKNENFYDATNVTMPEIKFYLSDDRNNIIEKFKNGDWLIIDELPTKEFANIQKEYGDEITISEQLGTYYICWNINKNILPESSNYNATDSEEAMAEIRNAIGLLIDRNYIVNNISLCNETPASTYIPKGILNPDGTQFYQNTGFSKEYYGYYNVSDEAFEGNYKKAIMTLKKYYEFNETTGEFVNIPTLTYVYNTSDKHQAIGEYIKSALATVGINIELKSQDWEKFLNTCKSGNYTIALNGWFADYNYPVSFLDTWTTSSSNNDVQFGKGSHKNLELYDLDLTVYGIDYKVKDATWSETYDVLIHTIKTSNDIDLCYELMHLAEDMLMSTGCINPIYYYTDILMVDSSVKGLYCNPLGYKYFMHTSISLE